MIEDEHCEICEADRNEQKFVDDVRKFLQKEFPGAVIEGKDYKIELPRAQPCQGFRATHRLEYDPRTGEYTPVPIVQQYERCDP